MDQSLQVAERAHPHAGVAIASREPGIRPVTAQWAWATAGLSPMSTWTAYWDWAWHLACSPAKQGQLAIKAGRKYARLLRTFTNLPCDGCPPCIEPLPQDRRFSAPEWRMWPFNLVYQSFLLTQQWWHNATQGVPGVTPHHEQLMIFASRQLLDMVAPSNFIALNPVVLHETFRRGGRNLLEGMYNWAVDSVRLLAGVPEATADAFLPGRGVAITPGKVIYRNRLIELIQYAPQTDTVYAEPVLLVPPWIMKYYILDLSPPNSLVRFLVRQGHSVVMLSWRNPDENDRELGMNDYLASGVLCAIDIVEATFPGRRMHALGYCLGGTLLAIAAAVLGRRGDTRLRSLTLLAAQLDFSEPGELGIFIDENQLAYLDALMARQGYLDGKQMQGAFALLNSKDMVWSRIVQNYLLGRSGQPRTELAAWTADATRMPYRQHSEYLRHLYLHNDLVNGRYVVDGKAVCLADIRLPIFALGARRDTVAPWKSVYKVHAVTDAEITFCLASGGHNAGIVAPPGPSADEKSYQIGVRDGGAPTVDAEQWWRQMPNRPGSWWPAWADWLKQKSGERVEAGAVWRASAMLDPAPGRYVLMA
ncbi:alpha/beta fold hydrolase [Massilia atriviolacea]|uniref:Alpha/beta fold hydrolase n=1 Tax=Massilia atriviolacea TaxID=2495579 RepID=A0A430HUE9_9BURK|nr:alpha/beta fold hydrolase [Massilia atriviolacea]RSZ61119.1 alpha/beta fold hydrolase [Massilia atriviolacea]